MDKILFIITFCCAIYFINCKIPSIITLNGNINETETINISYNKEYFIFFQYNQTNEDEVLRISTEAFINKLQSVLVVIKNGFDLTSGYKMINTFNSTSIKYHRTICPVLNMRSYQQDLERIVSIELSTKSSKPIRVDVHAKFMQQFTLNISESRGVSLDYNSPQFFLFKYPVNVQQVEVRVEVLDKNDICMIMSIQQAQCPVHMNEAEAKFSGSFQTITTTGTMTLEKSQYPNIGFFLVFVLASSNHSCHKVDSIIDVNGYNSSYRHKKFKVSINDMVSTWLYLLPVFGAIGFYLMFYVMAIIISIVYRVRFDQSPIEIEVEETTINPIQATHYGTIDEVADMQTLYTRNHQYLFDLNEEFENSGTVTSDKDSEYRSYDSCSDVSSDPNIYRMNKNLVVSDLAKKSPIIMNRKYFLYMWYLVIISVFYILPVIQLVVTYQQIVHITGNEDMCYYNFRCARPFSIFSAFNNIISNIGYVMLGVLFMLITYRRNIRYNEEKRFRAGIFNKGIPQYYGLFYAMGMALTMEGILSACYHICPSDINFQFDTAYMYILACLCMIKIYQIRHPDVNATAHSFYMTMAVIIFFGVIGVIKNSRVFWIVFMLIYILTIVFMSLEIYYLGRWRFSPKCHSQIYSMILVDKWRCFIPTYKRRMVVIAINYIVNISLALYGGISAPKDFASYFLAIFMMNLMMYFAFYIFMKVQYCEHFNVLSVVYIFIAMICWAFAIYCFINHPTDWQLTPSKSRELNQDCIFLNFYDIHDVWHFLSALSMFFSFMALQTLDDSLFETDRSTIPVF